MNGTSGKSKFFYPELGGTARMKGADSNHRYCQQRGHGDSLKALHDIGDAAWPIYLDWRCRNSPNEGHCTTTVDSWFKRLCSNYRIKVSRAGASDQARAQVRKVLGEGEWLVRKYALNREGREQETANFNDYFETISTLHRAPLTKLFFRREAYRARLWRFEILLAGTGIRLGAFMDNSRSQDERKLADKIGEFNAVTSVEDLPRYKNCALIQYPAKDRGRYGD